MSEISKIKKPIEAELHSFNSRFGKAVLTDSGLLGSVIHYVLKRKGKQLRPILVFLSAGACGKITEKTHNAATLIELMHTATLIHDDVVDDSHLRRNFFSINGLWKNKVAVLIGDYLLARGLLLSVKYKELDMLEVVSTAVDQMSRGEILQIKKSRQLDITEEEYFEIIEKKTASLIGACAKAGAVSAGASPEQIQAMYEFGINLGMAFQIKDDLFDYQIVNNTGKPSGNDLKEKKLTLPLIFARNKAGYRERRKLLKIIKSKNQTHKQICSLVEIVSEKGGFIYATEKMNDYRSRALHCLNQLPESDYQYSLRNLVEFVIDRKE